MHPSPSFTRKMKDDKFWKEGLSTCQIVDKGLTQGIDVIFVDVNCKGTSVEDDIFDAATRNILNSSSLVFDESLGEVHVYVRGAKSRGNVLNRRSHHCSLNGSDIIADAQGKKKVVNMYCIAVTYTNTCGTAKQAEINAIALIEENEDRKKWNMRDGGATLPDTVDSEIYLYATFFKLCWDVKVRLLVKFVRARV